jgi:Rrf2 family protein
MRSLSEGVEWAAHCVVFLAGLPEGAALPASRLAEYHGVPPAYLAKSMQALTRAGLVSARQGRGGGYLLTRAPEQITLLDVVLAVEGDEPMFRCTEIRKRGPARVASRQYPPLCGIAATFGRAEAAWRAELEATTIAEIQQVVARQAPPRALSRTTAWLAGVVTVAPQA